MTHETTAQLSDGGHESRFDIVKDRFTLIASIIALVISIYGFVEQNVLHQHELRAMVLSLGGTDDPALFCDIVLANTGTHAEVLYDAYFVYGVGTLNAGGARSERVAGPLSVKAGEVQLISVKGSKPEWFDKAATKPDGVRVGVVFRAVDSKGGIPNNDDAKLFRFTTLRRGPVGAQPNPDDNLAFIDLLH